MMPAEVMSGAVTVGANPRAKAPRLVEQLLTTEAIEVVIDVHKAQDTTACGDRPTAQVDWDVPYPRSASGQGCAGRRGAPDKFSRPGQSCSVTAGSDLTKEQDMVIVAGHLIVDPEQRESYLADCVSVVEEARQAPGCLDFTIAADLVDPGRIDVFEHWESQADVEAFRGSGPSEEQGAAVLGASVAEYDVASVRSLT